MSTLNLPSNVKQDSNTGAFIITNAQGKTLRVAAGTQDQLDAYVNSVNTGTPITVTTTSPSTGNPVTREFNPTAIYNAQEDSGSRLAAMTAVKRQTGIIGNADGSYYDLRTSQTITREQAEAKVAAAGLPPESLNLVTPRSSPAYNEAQASLDNTVNLPSNLGGTAAPLNPVQSPAGPGTGAVVTQSVPPYTTTGVASTVTPTPTANAASPLQADGDEALAAAQAAQEVADLRIAAESANPVSPLDTGYVSDAEQIAQANADAAFNARLDRAAELDLANSGDAALEAADRAREAADLQTAALTYSPAPVSTLTALDSNEFGTPNVVQNQDDVNANAAVTRGLINNAQNQSTLQTRQNTPAAADWRVRLRLAPNANYLYKVPASKDGSGGPGILAPLAATDGVVFPYTPAIETSYQAKYANYDLTHSNYRGYFYQNSSVENITIKGTFTAQDTREAAYLLAVIHFFKSVTKMFYGQDAEAGTPPPLVYLSGFGKYQFNESPCVVTTFGYSLPTDVDYIRANGFNNIGLNMENRRNQSSGPAIGGSLGTVVAILDRLSNAGLSNGSLTNRPSPSQVNQNVTNQTSINSTYVPTKMEISITLLPMQTRNQVSKQFSLKSFANGSLLAGGGFW
tara:strand:+ start:749 stop:2635 length:1887 start_codon:yes stop_codon:yes gene_type:complete